MVPLAGRAARAPRGRPPWLQPGGSEDQGSEHL